MLLMSLTYRYKAISREIHTGSPLERTIDAQTRFVYAMSRTLRRPEAQMCLEQVQAKRQQNHLDQQICLGIFGFTLAIVAVLCLWLPSLSWIGAVIPAFQFVRLLFLKRTQQNLIGIERCLRLLQTDLEE